MAAAWSTVNSQPQTGAAVPTEATDRLIEAVMHEIADVAAGPSPVSRVYLPATPPAEYARECVALIASSHTIVVSLDTHSQPPTTSVFLDGRRVQGQRMHHRAMYQPVARLRRQLLDVREKAAADALDAAANEAFEALTSGRAGSQAVRSA